MKEFCNGKTIAQAAYCVQKMNLNSTGGNSFGNLLFDNYDQNHRRQLLKIMQLTVILLLGAFLQVNANVYAQATVTLSEKNAPLEKVIKSIERQTGYVFMYESKLTQVLKRVTIDVINAPIKDALDICFKDLPISYNIVDKTIIVKQRKQQVEDTNKLKEKLIDIKGRILDKKGIPLPGVTVRVEGTTKTTFTNANGEFKISNISDNSKLIISSIGFETKIITVTSSQDEIVIILNIKANDLDETVVIAYGNTTRKFKTGNISSVKASEIENQPISNPLLALQGRVSGLYVTQNTGVPNGSVTVRIQGQNSISSGNDPLIIIDGVPYFSTFPLTTFPGPTNGNSSAQGSPLSFINPQDIESIEILKDADATAIYGSRGANGVIMVTTKKGIPGFTKVNIRILNGWGKVPKKLKLLNSRQYLDMRYEAFKNDAIDWKSPNVSANDLKVWDTTRNTDWQDVLIGGTAQYTNINTNISGGSDQVQYMVSAGFQKEGTVFPGNFNNTRGSLHLNLNGSSKNKKLTFSFIGNYMYDNNKLPSTDLTNAALIIEPIAPPIYTADGILNWAPDANGTSTWNNPLAGTILKDYKNTTKSLVNNINLTYNIIRGLAIKSNIGYRQLVSDLFLPIPIESIRPELRQAIPRSASFSFSNYSSWIVEPFISYKTNLNKISIDAVIGSTIQNDINDVFTATGNGFSSNANLQNMGAAASITSTSEKTNYKYNALFSRININTLDRYILSLTARRDGSSRFGDKNKLHNFGSIGIGWIFTNEPMIKINSKILSFGKLRASYGTVGNDQIGEYNRFSSYVNTTTGIPYQNLVGLRPGRHFNPYLQWEETKKLQLGFDLELFNGKLNVEAGYANNRSSNQLLQNSLPTITGFNSVLSNFPALIQNINWEFGLKSTNYNSKYFSWSSNFNITIPRNKVLSFPNIELTNHAAGRNGVIIGQPIGIMKTLRYLGVNPDDGTYMISDKDGHPIITGNPALTDYTELISTRPTLYGGLTNTLSFKGITLDFLLQFVKQRTPRHFYYDNNNRVAGNFFAGLSNQPATVLNRWKDIGDNAEIAKFTTRQTLVPWVGVSNDFYTYDGSFIRLKNLSLSWTLPDRLATKLHLASGKLFFQGQNILTLSNSSQLDPESSSGVTAILPALRMLSLGIQISL